MSADLERIAGAEEDGRGEQDGQPGQGQDEVGEAHQQVVDDAAVVAGDRADRRADRRREEGDEERDPERRPEPEDDAAQVVATELVGAEEVPVLERRAAGRC